MLPEPFCQFCRKRVQGEIVNGDWVPEHYEFDYDELHAIEIGIGDGLLLVAPMWRAWELHGGDWHYYIIPRGITTGLLILTVGVLLWLI